MATLPVFRTWVAGEIVTAAFLNSNVRDAGNFFLSWPAFEGRQALAQSIASVTPTPILLDTEDVDTDSGHSTATNTSRYTPQTQGRYMISGGISWAANGTGIRNTELWKNGAAISGGGTTYLSAGSGLTSRYPSRTMTVSANGSTDYVELVGYQSSGVALSTAVAGIEQPTLSVRMVGTT